MGNQSILKQWLCDSGIAFLLILAGLFVTRALADRFEAHGSIGYLFCLAIAEIPFIYFLGMRRGFFRWWEYAGFLGCIVSMSVARDLLVRRGASGTFAVTATSALIFACFICLHHAVQCQSTVHAAGRSASRQVDAILSPKRSR